MLRLAVAIVQTKLYILIYMRDHAEDVLHGTLLRVVKPRLFIGAFPESSIHCEVDLDGKFFSWNLVLQSAHCAEQSGFVDLKPCSAILVVQGDDNICACGKTDLEPGAFGYDTVFFQAPEGSVALNGSIIVACCDRKIVKFCNVLLDFRWVKVFRLGSLIHDKRSHALWQRTEDSELPGCEV